jgi:hypothetical protein
MVYNPNFNNPRVIDRCKLALGFACAVMSETKSHPWSSRYIDEFFGMSTNPLSKYLRKKLLICTDEFYRFNQLDPKKNKCKEYILNKEGVRYIRDQLKISNTLIYPSVIQVTAQEFKQQLDSGEFNYTDKSDRLWHPLQRYRREYRTQILADFGYLHDYDIQCCAPTLIHQYSQQCGMDQYLFALRKYLADRNTIRNELAAKMELPPEAIKEIINALFAGAIISNNKRSDIYHILNGDRVRIEYLKQDPFITELRSDIKTCWQYITPYLSRRRNTKTNRLVKITSRQKWNVYFDLERVVLNSVRTHLDNLSLRYFLMHDGWSCERELDREVLRDYVKCHTGYDLQFDYEKISNTLIYPSVIQVS